VIGKDEVIVQMNGATVSGPHKLGKGDDVTLNTLRSSARSRSRTRRRESAR
jgi:hypothetical protein